MKKTIQILCVAMTLAVALVSCKKDEMVNTVTPNSTATISGLARVNLDVTNDTNSQGAAQTTWNQVPEGVTIYATISTDELTQFENPATNYGQKTYTTTVAADGSYTLTVEANVSTVNVTITADDFLAAERDWLIVDSLYSSKDKIYELGATTESVIAGSTRLINLDFSKK